MIYFYNRAYRIYSWIIYGYLYIGKSKKAENPLQFYENGMLEKKIIKTNTKNFLWPRKFKREEINMTTWNN